MPVVAPSAPEPQPPAVTYSYQARVLRIIDADTYDVEVELGFRVVARLPLRLAHVDAPEHNTPAGKDAITAVERLMGPMPCPVIVTTFKPIDKFGRYLADVWVAATSVADFLLTIKLATPYEGGKKSVPVMVVANVSAFDAALARSAATIAETAATMAALKEKVDGIEDAVVRGAQKGMQDRGEK